MVVDLETLYTLYLDESGVGKPGKRDYEYFVFGGVLIRKPDEHALEADVDALKGNWNISPDVPLHATEIRTKRDRFHFLQDLPAAQVVKFKTEILEMVERSAVLLHGCVVHRQKYLDRYSAVYGRNTWQMLKSATIITVERAARYVQSKGGKLYVVFERGNKSSNTEIRRAYKELRENGAPFNQVASLQYSPMSAADLQSVLFKIIEPKTKASKMLQVADMCLLPLVEHKRTGNTQVVDRLRAAGRLIDCDVPDPPKMGIKYYCFDP
jgi:hypothetical protein